MVVDGTWLNPVTQTPAQLTAVVPAGLIAAAGTRDVYVFTEGRPDSNHVTLTVQ